MAVWSGFVSVDLRGDYAFQAELNGSFSLDINGKRVLETQGNNPGFETSKPVRLNKGRNSLAATFRSPARGDAWLRVTWSSKEISRGPIPLSALAHAADPELEKATRAHLGRELFVEHRCFKCHASPAPDTGMIELSMDAPAFEGIGSRRNYPWLARWILNPKAQRSSARMPRLLHGAHARQDAEAIAGFLVSLKADSTPSSPAAKEPVDQQKEIGRKLFDALQCIACHQSPEGKDVDQTRISLNHVHDKFRPAALKAFLKRPEAQYAWTRMPNFKLSDDEAGQLTAYLEAQSTPAKESPEPSETSLLERGKKLVQTAGCLNCHTLKLENQFSAKSLPELGAEAWKRGCLAPLNEAGSRSPEFDFFSSERQALQAFAATDRASLKRHVPAEFAERQTRLLNCRECHGKFEGFPPLNILGQKLKPAWSKAFLAGEIPYKPRPWLEARMPAFATRADGLAQGLAMQHGFPPQTSSEVPVDMEAAKVGQKLVSAVGGFSCISCHGIGEMAAMQAFEAPGINLAQSGERLLKDYFQRWVRNPIQIEPTTKMPVYFDEEGRSPLTEFYDGDGEKQINALWDYVRLGDKMPPPPTQ